MPTRVEHILPNAAGTPLQLWFNNVNSVWLSRIEWHVGQVWVIVGVLYFWRLYNLEISTPTHQLNNCDGSSCIPLPFQNLCHARHNLARLPINVLGSAGWDSCWHNIHDAFYRLQPSHSFLLCKLIVHLFTYVGGYNSITWLEWTFLMQLRCTSTKGNLQHAVYSSSLDQSSDLSIWMNSWPNFWQTRLFASMCFAQLVSLFLGNTQRRASFRPLLQSETNRNGCRISLSPPSLLKACLEMIGHTTFKYFNIVVQCLAIFIPSGVHKSQWGTPHSF